MNPKRFQTKENGKGNGIKSLEKKKGK